MTLIEYDKIGFHEWLNGIKSNYFIIIIIQNQRHQRSILFL
jgi:hypothetical protein